MERAVINSPIGFIELGVVDGRLCSINFLDETMSSSDSQPENDSTSILQQAISELKEYFQGSRKKFGIPISLENSNPTQFQLSAWKQLLKISFGDTISYKDQASKMGVKAFRAVGNANGKNPLPIVIPCHRVISSDGSLGGYSSGIWRKKFLLNLEGVGVK